MTAAWIPPVRSLGVIAALEAIHHDYWIDERPAGRNVSLPSITIKIAKVCIVPYKQTVLLRVDITHIGLKIIRIQEPSKDVKCQRVESGVA